MSKAQDPSFPFYSSDFLTGTQFMNDDQCGKYIRLLCLHHQKGRLTEKQILVITKARDEEIFSKFIVDENGMYYNERLELEIRKREGWIKSRRSNLTGKKSFIPPTLEEAIQFFKQNGYNETGATTAWKYYEDGNWHDSKGSPVLNWKQKMRAVWFKVEYALPKSDTTNSWMTNKGGW